MTPCVICEIKRCWVKLILLEKLIHVLNCSYNLKKNLPWLVREIISFILMIIIYWSWFVPVANQKIKHEQSIWQYNCTWDGESYFQI